MGLPGISIALADKPASGTRLMECEVTRGTFRRAGDRVARNLLQQVDYFGIVTRETGV